MDALICLPLQKISLIFLEAEPDLFLIRVCACVRARAEVSSFHIDTGSCFPNNDYSSRAIFFSVKFHVSLSYEPKSRRTPTF